jgi:hypothetical protein
VFTGLLCKQGVAGSIPVTSTNFFSDCKGLNGFISAPIPPYVLTLTVHIGAASKSSAAVGAISLARRLSFSGASRFIVPQIGDERVTQMLRQNRRASVQEVFANEVAEKGKSAPS